MVYQKQTIKEKCIDQAMAVVLAVVATVALPIVVSSWWGWEVSLVIFTQFFNIKPKTRMTPEEIWLAKVLDV